MLPTSQNRVSLLKLHPLLAGMAWTIFMGMLALAFLGVRYLWALMTAVQQPHFLAYDQPLSFGILLIVSFIFGFSVSWIQQRLINSQKPRNRSDHTIRPFPGG